MTTAQASPPVPLFGPDPRLAAVEAKRVRDRKKRRRLIMVVAALFVLAGVLTLAGVRPSSSSGYTISKADNEACNAEMFAHVIAAPFVPTSGERQTYYNYCIDLRQGRVPDARPDF